MKLAILTSDGREMWRRYDEIVPSFGTAPRALLQGLAREPGLELHVISCAQQPMRSPEKLAENIYFHCLHVPKLGWMRTLYQGCILATRRKLREIGPDIVHGQGTERDCAISAVRSGFPVVITIHGNMGAVARGLHARPGSFYWLNARLEDWTLPRCRGVLCNSSYTEALVRPRNPRTWRVANPLREMFFAPLPARATGGPVRLVTIGTITRYKRQLDLLDVARRFHARGFAFHWEFLGMVARDEYGAAFLREIELPENRAFASFSGFQEDDAVVSAFDRADACIHFPTEEAFGLVVAEALARNLKFFGSRIGGPIDIAEGVEGAELVAPDDLAGLENALVRWMESGAPRPISAAQTMRERYHPTVIARRHVEIYEEVLASGNRPR